MIIYTIFSHQHKVWQEGIDEVKENRSTYENKNQYNLPEQAVHSLEDLNPVWLLNVPSGHEYSVDVFVPLGQ